MCVTLTIVLLLCAGYIYHYKIKSKVKHQTLTIIQDLELMNKLFDATPHPLYVRDTNARLIIANSCYLKFFNVALDEIIGKKVAKNKILSHSEAHNLHIQYLRIMESVVSESQNLKINSTSNQKLILHHWIVPLTDDDGKILGILGGWEDITSRHMDLENLHKQKTEAEFASRAKTLFIATMSHEIRTPLNAVIGMLELVSKKSEQGIIDRHSLDVAYLAATELLNIIGDVLDVSRIELKNLNLKLHRSNIYELVKSVVQTFEDMARKKNIELSFEIDLGYEGDNLIDASRLKQILFNIIGNAVKFTHNGGIAVFLTTYTSNDHKYSIMKITVKDTGIGVSAEELEKLFKPFAQAENSNESGRNGTGLGLFICRNLCELMGGQLTLSSTIGVGTEVEIMLKLKPVQVPLDLVKQTLETSISKHSLNILIIDDYLANRLLLIEQLRYLGHEVVGAENGVQAISIWRGQHFDVVITDCHMPLMSGFDLARTIRAEEPNLSRPLCLILGLTANVQAKERENCLIAGMNDCMFKPTNLATLNNYLNSIDIDRSTYLEFCVTAEVEGNYYSSIEKLTNSEPQVIRKLLSDLFRSNDEDMRSLTRLFNANDILGISDLAHRVKGGAKIINIHYLIERCEEVESACLNIDSACLLNSVENLQLAMERLSKELNNELS